MVHGKLATIVIALAFVAGPALAAEPLVEEAAAPPVTAELEAPATLAVPPEEAPAEPDAAWDAFMATLPDASAESAGALTPATRATVGNPTTSLGRAGAVGLLGALALMVLLAIPATRRRLLDRLRPASRPGAEPLEVTIRGSRSLGGGQRVVALEVDGVRLLVGMSPGRMDVLHTSWGAPEPTTAPATAPLAPAEALSVAEAVLAARSEAPTSRELVGAWRRQEAPAPKEAPATPSRAEPAWWMEGATDEEAQKIRGTAAEDEAVHAALRAARARITERAQPKAKAPAARAPEPAFERKATGTDGPRKAARFVLLLAAAVLVPALMGLDLATAAEPAMRLELGGAAEGGSAAIKLLATLTLLAVAPALVLAMTSFTRLIVVFSLLRQAIGVQQAPPNQVLIGLALFLTWFVMGPTFTQVQAKALTPWMDGAITEGVALENAMVPMRDFMFKNTREQDLALFLRLDRSVRPATRADVPSRVLVPAFLISELKTAFTIGFLLYIPFLVIDIVVSTVLLAMGMMVLPPVVISLPFKLLLFVFVDGWNLLVGSLVGSFA